MNKQLTVKLATPSVTVTETRQQLTAAGTLAPTPTSRALPPFSAAIAHADPHGLVAVAEDLPGTRGHKRIVLNATDVVSDLPPDCAWWVWPWEDVQGRQPTDPDDLLDLRRWEGRSWLEMVDGVQHRGVGQPSGWWAAIGVVVGSTVGLSTVGMFGGITWAHPWGWPVPRGAYHDGDGTWRQHNGNAREQSQGRYGELGWFERGEWIQDPVVNLLDPDAKPYTPYAMAQGGGLVELTQPVTQPLHLALVVGNHTGSGLADSLTVRPAHSFRRKRY